MRYQCDNTTKALKDYAGDFPEAYFFKLIDTGDKLQYRIWILSSLLKFFGEARGMNREEIGKRMDEVINLCALSSVLHKPIGKLSRGFRQRVGMAQALLHEPQVLIMDEPTAGLDPNQINGVRETMQRLGKNRTILLSTHILQEVEAVANRVIMINEGSLVYDGPTSELYKSGESMDGAFERLAGSAQVNLQSFSVEKYRRNNCSDSRKSK